MKLNAFAAATSADSAMARPSAATWMLSIVNGIRKSSADRAMRRQLAELDDALLRDIGIGEDEIWRVRSQQNFTPRAWH
jgi:uncharacterized protein YjiS (DUF1127 family)